MASSSLPRLPPFWLMLIWNPSGRMANPIPDGTSQLTTLDVDPSLSILTHSVPQHVEERPANQPDPSIAAGRDGPTEAPGNIAEPSSNTAESHNNTAEPPSNAAEPPSNTAESPSNTADADSDSSATIMADSPESSLSSHASSEFDDDNFSHDAPDIDDTPTASATGHPSSSAPATKRQKLADFASPATPDLGGAEDDYDDVSSDTSGDIPNSPTNAHMTDDDPPHEQVTVCKWMGCARGDCGDMDELVKHIHDEHVGSRKKTYACEWDGCGRLGSNHASGYALKAHMRSHTREKPFFCKLPECDRSFTRSDALAKHMRTVHETEALRPSDPIPRSHSSLQAKPQRLKLVLNARSSAGGSSTPDASSQPPALGPTASNPYDYPPDVAAEMEPEELLVPPDQYYRVVRRQLHWTELEGERRKLEALELIAKYMREWLQNHLVLYNVVEAELAASVDGRVDFAEAFKLKDLFLPANMLPIHGGEPWYRRQQVADPTKGDETGVQMEGAGSRGVKRKSVGD